MELVYTYIVSSNHILVITMGKPFNLSTAAMNPCVGRRQYLVTYSQADELRKFFHSRKIWQNSRG